MRAARTRGWLVVLGVLGMAACGDTSAPSAPRVRSGAPSDSPNAPPPVASLSASASARAIASGSAGPSTSALALASASASAAPIVETPVPSGPVKWADFTGPFEKPRLKGGEHVWAVMPVSTGWETLKFSEHEVSRVDEKTVIFSIGGTDYEVPSVFVNQVDPPRDILKGHAVMASAHDSRVFGRVMDVGRPTPTDPIPKVKVRYRFASDTEDLDVEPAGLIKLDGRLKFGAPVIVQEDPKEGAKIPKVHTSQFVSSDGTSTWVVTSTGKAMQVPNATVHVMSISTTRKAGEKVWVARQEEIVPGMIREVLDDGVRYRIDLDAGGETVVTLETVTGPIPGTIAH